MSIYRTNGKAGRVRICIVLAVVALAGLALVAGPAAAGQTAAQLQAAHAAYLTQGATLSAHPGATAAATDTMRSALVAARTNGTELTQGTPGYVAIVPPLTQPVGKATPVSEPGIGSGITALIAVAALIAVGLIAAFTAGSRSSARKTAPATLRPAASAPTAPDDRLRHAA
jgi:hypothetical protein